MELDSTSYQKIIRVCGTLILLSSVFLLCLTSQVYAQGLNIPASSSFNVNTGTLNIEGDLDNDGTLVTTTGTVGLTGDWDNATGTYTANSGTVDLNGSGAQTLNSSGTGAGKLFYNLTHSGSGTTTVSTSDLNIDNNFTNSAGTFDANGQAMTVAGDWSNSGTFTSNSNTVTFDGTTQSLSGNTTFYNFSKSVAAADTMTFDNTATQTITNALTLQGASSQLLSLRSDSSGDQWGITLQAGGTQSIQYVDVQDSDASGGLLLLAGATSTNSGNNTNWSFGGTTITWDGSDSTDWDDADNWDLGVVPGSSDTAVIAGGPANQPQLSSNVTVDNLTLQASATVTLDGYDLTVSDTLSNLGTIIAQGDESISITTIDTDSGTFRFVGDAAGGSSTFTIPDFGGQDYYNLVINDSAATSDVHQTNSNLTVLGALTVTDGELNISTNTNTLTVTGVTTVNGGVLTATNGNINADSDVVLSSGTLTAPGSAQTFTVAGDWTYSGGTFTASSGTVTLDGTGQTISGSTTFYGLSKTVAAADTLTFEQSETQTITNSLALNGASGQLLSLVSDNPATDWLITLQAGGTQSLQYLDVQDSDASGGLTLVGRNSTDSGNNTNWVFGGTTMTWDGSTDTDWDDASNWDLGIVPTDADTAVIADVANQPTLSSNVQVENLTVNSSADMNLAGFDLTVDSTLSNDGTINFFGDESISIGTNDTDSGTFVLTGDGDGSAETFTISDLGATDFYNLTINDTDANSDTFRTNGNLTIANNLTITDGALDISTNTNTLTTTGTLTVNGGVLTATNGNIDANGSVVLSSGTLTAPGSSNTFTVAGGWTNTGGTFTPSGGEVALDTAATVTIAGDTTFYDFEISTAGKQVNFTAGTTQTVNNTFTAVGTSGNEIVLRSTAGASKWDITFPNGAQNVQSVDVQDSDANTNTITCFECSDSGNNNANWLFSSLAVTVPTSGSTVDTTPTVTGTAASGSTVEILDNGNNVIATTTADTNNNFYVEVAEASALSAGANTLTPRVGGTTGTAINVTVAASPTPSQVPTITSHSDDDRVNGSLPTIVGQGLAGQTVTIYAADPDGTFLVQSVGSGTVDGSGDYSVTISTAVPKGDNDFYVVVNGTASTIVTLEFTDPFGVVFDSVTNNPIENATVTIYRSSDDQLAVVGTDLDPGDVNPVTTGSDGFYSFLTVNNDYYIVVEATGYDYPSSLTSFPAGRTIVTGSKAEVFTVAGVIIEMDHPVDSNNQLIRVEKDANKSEARVGDVVTYTVTIQNLSSTAVEDVFIEDRIPAGFKYVNARVTLDGSPIAEPTGNRPLTFDVGDFTANQTKTLKYQLVVGTGVNVGSYENAAHAKYSTGQIISNRATEAVNIILDPLFDLGTVIGKVFYDLNGNGVQDPPRFNSDIQKEEVEAPIPSVRIVMEDGTIVTTDSDGQYNIPALTPGRHLLRIDERTLPEGSYLTTEKVQVVDITPGMMFKVNFGVAVDYERYADEEYQFFSQQVKVQESTDRSEPRLHASLFGSEIMTYNNLFVEPVEFRIFTNYAPYIEYWKFEIVDADTNKPVKTFSGDGLTIHEPIIWDGSTDQQTYLRDDRDYEYRVYVEGANQRFDETKPQSLSFRELDIKEDVKIYKEARTTRRAGYNRWLLEQYLKNSLNVQTILVDGQTLTIDPLTTNIRSIKVVKGNALVTEVPVYRPERLSANDILEEGLDKSPKLNTFDVILPRGEYDVVIQEGEWDSQASYNPSTQTSAVSAIDKTAGKVKTYKKSINVGKDYMFFVAMGDGKIGYTSTRGNVEAAGDDDKYKDGLWAEGKMAYYLKGKILGKYLITSSFDSDRDRKEIFRNLNEDEYYPVYGDQSSVNYSATNTQGNLYVLVEWDKSSALWGNYSVGFDDTEFARFSRSLYGAKIDYKSLSSTPFGDARSSAVVFHSNIQQKSAHNEILSTGSSIYYLKHKDILEGSEKINVQVRDKITGVVLSERTMVEGADFEMDYTNGRIIFWQPLPILIDSYSIIDSNLLQGNPVYVIADYEYDVKDKIDESSYGTRVEQAVGDNVVLGGTYVSETQASGDYELTGADVTINISRDAKVIAEFAQSQSEAEEAFISTDGGLSFTQLSTADGAQDKAYGIKGDARLFNRLGLAAYYKWVGDDFSTSATTAQQGKEVLGGEVTYDVSDNTRVTARYDVQSLIDDGNLQTQAQVGATKTATSLLQVVHQIRKLKLTAAYSRTEVTEKLAQFDTETNREQDSLALKAEYDISDRLAVSVTQQLALSGEGIDQTTLGVTAKPTDNIIVEGKQIISEAGTATTVGVKADTTGRLTLSTDHTLAQAKNGDVSTISNVGAGYRVDDATRLNTSVGVTDKAGDTLTNITLGGTAQVDKDTTTLGQIAMSETATGQEETSYTFGTTKRINDEFKIATTQTLGNTGDKQSTSYRYGLIKEKDGRKLEGTLSRQYTQDKTEVSQANIFGLSGDVDDRWALKGTFQTAEVQNLDGTQTDRKALTFAAGYVFKDQETGEDLLKSSTKLEVRFDEGQKDSRQFLIYNAIEGKINPEVTLFSRFEYSKTRNTSQDFTEAQYKEIVVGGAYRPILFDRLNLVGRYTYLEDLSPQGQVDSAQVTESSAHVIATEAVYDVNQKWQVSEKFAYRIGEEKVEGFDFTKTHTWLMIHRLNYKIDSDWSVSGEFRMLAQKEARDARRGVLIEAARQLGEFAQLGVGYNFTDFSDDLTDLDYTAQGPFVRLTGKLYDRTKEEAQRAREKWLHEKVTRWAWIMVQEEFKTDDSPILDELNEFFMLAEKAAEEGRLEESSQIYKDIIMAGQMMHQEAVDYIYAQIEREERLKEMQQLADEYYKNGQYDKAKKILEKILEDAE